MKHLGKLKDLRSETRRINKLIEDAFEEVDPEQPSTTAGGGRLLNWVAQATRIELGGRKGIKVRFWESRTSWLTETGI